MKKLVLLLVTIIASASVVYAEFGPNLWANPHYVNGTIIPGASTYNVGTTSKPFKDAHFSGTIYSASQSGVGNLDVTGNSSISGTLGIGGASALHATTVTGALHVTTTSALDGAVTALDTIDIGTAGKSLRIKSGSNAKCGTLIASGATGTTVTTTAITANSVVAYGLKTVGGTIAGKPYETTVTPGTSFVVKTGASDTSTYNYCILDSF